MYVKKKYDLNLCYMLMDALECSVTFPSYNPKRIHT